MDAASVTFNITQIAIMTANMLQDYLTANQMTLTTEDITHDKGKQNTATTHRQTGLYLPSTIHPGTSQIQSREHTTAVCAAAQ